MTERRARRVVLAAAGIGLLLRLAFGLGYWVDKPITHDEREYLRLARSISQGRGFVDEAPEPGEPGVLPPERFGRAPLYPLFLAVATAGARGLPAQGDPSRVPVSVKIVQSIVGAAGVVLLAGIARRSAGPTAGAIAASLAAVHPPLVWIAAYALSEGVYWVLALAAVAVLSPFTDDPLGPEGRRRWPRAMVAGALAGAAALTRPASVVFIALAAAWLAIRTRTLATAAFATLAAALVILPWTARNVREYGRVVLIASEGGITFWTGNHPLSPGEGDMAANPAIKRANQDLRRRHPGLSPEEMEPIYYREALAYIASHPLEWLGLLLRKAVYTWVPMGPSYTLHSRRYFLASAISYAVLLVPACAGFLRLRRASRPPRALWLLAASVVLVCLVFFPQERFRIPVIDPTLIVCAAAWLALRGHPGGHAGVSSRLSGPLRR